MKLAPPICTGKIFKENFSTQIFFVTLYCLALDIWKGKFNWPILRADITVSQKYEEKLPNSQIWLCWHGTSTPLQRSSRCWVLWPTQPRQARNERKTSGRKSDGDSADETGRAACFVQCELCRLSGIWTYVCTDGHVGDIIFFNYAAISRLGSMQVHSMFARSRSHSCTRRVKINASSYFAPTITLSMNRSYATCNFRWLSARITTVASIHVYADRGDVVCVWCKHVCVNSRAHTYTHTFGVALPSVKKNVVAIWFSAPHRTYTMS